MNIGAKPVPCCFKSLLHSCMGYCMQGLHHTRVTSGSGNGEIRHGIVYLKFGIWKSSSVPVSWAESPAEAASQAPEPRLPGSTSLWGAETTADHCIPTSLPHPRWALSDIRFIAKKGQCNRHERTKMQTSVLFWHTLMHSTSWNNFISKGFTLMGLNPIRVRTGPVLFSMQ